MAQPRTTDVEDVADKLIVEGLSEVEYAVNPKFTPNNEDATEIEDEHPNNDPSNAGSETSEEEVSSSDDDRDKYDDDDEDDDNGDNNGGENDFKHDETSKNNVHHEEASVKPDDDDEEDDEGDSDDDEEEPDDDESPKNSGRFAWDKMNDIPHETFKALFDSKLPGNRRMLATCVAGTSRGAYHFVVFINCLNLDHKLEQFVIKIPAHGVPGIWRGEDKYMLTQEAATMQYLHANTTMPVPEVIAYWAEVWGHWGFPYIIMSRLPGKQASFIWFDEDFDFSFPNRVHDIPSIQTEKRRINFLRSLAREMSKLKDVPFRGIGMPCLGYVDTDSVVLGHQVDSTYIYTSVDDPESVQEHAACYSTQDYIRAAIEKWRSEMDVYYTDGFEAVAAGVVPDDSFCQYQGLCKMLNMVYAHPVLQSTAQDFFYLQHDDLDLQNILVDDDGNVTGIIDWDGSLAMPRCAAQAAVPNFLRRNWFPDQNGTGAHLFFRTEHYCQVYAAAMVEAGNPDAQYTAKSGLYQAALAALFEYTGGCKHNLIENLLFRAPHINKDAVTFATTLGNPAVGWQLEDMIKAEIHKILDSELPQLDLQELAWHLTARVFMAEFDTFLMPPTFEELAEVWMAGFVEYFELGLDELEHRSRAKGNEKLEDGSEDELEDE